MMVMACMDTSQQLCRESSFSESLTGQPGSFDREWEAALMGEAGFYDIVHAANLHTESWPSAFSLLKLLLVAFSQSVCAQERC